MDWVSCYVLAWRLSNTLDAAFCVDALEATPALGRPEIFNTDQGCQFTWVDFTGTLERQGVPISMESKGRFSGQHFRRAAVRSAKCVQGYLHPTRTAPRRRLD